MKVYYIDYDQIGINKDVQRGILCYLSSRTDLSYCIKEIHNIYIRLKNKGHFNLYNSNSLIFYIFKYEDFYYLYDCSDWVDSFKEEWLKEDIRKIKILKFLETIE